MYTHSYNNFPRNSYNNSNNNIINTKSNGESQFKLQNTVDKSSSFSKQSTGRTVNQVNQVKAIYPTGILKLNYEIKYRKKEFLQFCMRYDTSFSGYIDIDDFKEIIDSFTCYPKLDEKQAIYNVFKINESYVNYIGISGLNIFEEIRYSDPYLIHLNEKINIPKAAILDSIVRNKSILDISPIEDLNKKISEENFLIKISKNVMEFILINSQKIQADEFFDKIFNQLDYDRDDHFTIGELSNLLNLSKVKITDHDLRFFFETINPVEGKIPRIKLKSFVYEFNQKFISKPANTLFVKSDNEIDEILTDNEKLQEDKIFKIMNDNEFINQILDSLFILGKTFLIKFFSKYLVIEKEKFLIDTVWLELGFKKLNYREIPSEDVGKFKYFCVLKNIGYFKDKMAVYVDIGYLFDFVTKYFCLEKKFEKKDSLETIEGISSRLLKDVSKLFISYEHNKISELEKRFFINNEKQHKRKNSSENGSQIKTTNDKILNIDEQFEMNLVVNEMNFRRAFINTFGFVDHFNLDHMINKLIFGNNLFNSNMEYRLNNSKLNNLFEANQQNIKAVNLHINEINLDSYYNLNFYDNLKDSKKIKNQQEQENKRAIDNDEKNKTCHNNDYYHNNQYFNSDTILENNNNNHPQRHKINTNNDILQDKNIPCCVDYLQECEEQTNDWNEQISFNVRNINNKKWVGLGFNLLFMSLIKFHEQVGLLLDIEDIGAIKNIYAKIEKRIFPKQRLTEKKIVNINQGINTVIYSEDNKNSTVSYDIEKNTFEKIDSNNDDKSNQESYFSPSSNKIKQEFNLMKIENEKVNKISDEIFVNENVFTGFIVQNDLGNNSQRNNNSNRPIVNNPISIKVQKKDNKNNNNMNLIAHISNKERKTLINVADSADVVPELYKLCTEYLLKTYNLDFVDFNILRSIGICKIFREHLKQLKIETREDIDYLALVANIRPIINEKIYKFLEYFAFRNKNKSNNLINIQQFFAKLEEILLQYSKIDSNKTSEKK